MNDILRCFPVSNYLLPGLFLLFVQGQLIGFRRPIQYITAINGLLSILIALLPSVRKDLTNKKASA
ncbi:MAG TPA: hypothetical protein PK843_19615 [bacterium]|nr:hypothetical protein [bacterium]